MFTTTRRRHALLTAICLFSLACTARAETGRLDDVTLAVWGRSDAGQTTAPAGNDFTQVTGGWNHSLALKSDGSLAAWGDNFYDQCDVPAEGDFTQVAAGWDHCLAIKSDGSLVAWGDNFYDQCDVPAGNDFTKVAAGGCHSLALKSDGSLVAWGLNSNGQSYVPAGNDFTKVAAGWYHNLALKSDGSLVAWGSNSNGQISVPVGNDFTQVAAGAWHNLALKSDGSLAAWGRNSNGETSVPTGNDFTQVAAGGYHSLALKSDGSLAAWGRNNYHQCNVPTEGYFLAVAAGGYHSLALQARPSYNDLLVTGDGATALLQRDVDVTGDATIESMMEIANEAVMTVAGCATISDGGGFYGEGSPIVGEIYAKYGSRIVATGDLTLGDAASFTGFVGEGRLEVGDHTMAISSRAMTKVGSLVSIDGGTMDVANGFSIDSNGMLVGTGAVNGRFINQGLVAAGGPGEDLTFNGLVSGAGSFTGSLIFNGGFSPGNSPTVQHFDWATFTENNTLTMEIGGLIAGEEYDQLIVNEQLTLGGTLDVELIDGFTPELGDTFTLFDGQLAGEFVEVNLPGLGDGLSWDYSSLCTMGTLTVVPEPSTLLLTIVGLLGVALFGWRKR